MELNKIYNKSCIEFMSSDLEPNSVSLIIADPPYNIAKKKPLKGKSHGSVETLSESWDIFDSEESYLNFTREWMESAKRVLKDNGSILIYGNWQSIYNMKNVMDEFNMHYLNTITWCKPDAPPNITRRNYAHSTEFILWYCKSDKNWIYNHDEIKKYNNSKQMRNFWLINRSMTKAERTIHKTQKKIELSNIIVEAHSNENDLVYIPFGGSGTEIESCILHNRNWVATETNEEYIKDIIEPRINKVIHI